MSNVFKLPEKPFAISDEEFKALDQQVHVLALQVLASEPDVTDEADEGAVHTLTQGEYANLTRLVVLSEIRTNHLIGLVMEKLNGGAA